MAYLAEAGCLPEDITFAVALGTHRRMASAEIALALGHSICPSRGLQIGPEARRMIAELKRRWDPAGILNAGVLS